MIGGADRAFRGFDRRDRVLANDRRFAFALFPLLVAGIGVAACASSPPQRVVAAPNRDDLARRIDAVVKEEMRAGPLAGLSLAVAKGNKILVANGYGFADVEKGARATPETVYELASVTKPIIAALVLQLSDEGKLRIDDDVTTYFPGLPVRERKPKISHLLSHTSGLKDPAIGPSGGGPPGREALAARARLAAAEVDPGDRFLYSGNGYLMLGLIVENVTGQPLAHVLRDRVTARHGLASIGASGSDASARRRTKPYYVVGNALREAPPGPAFAIPSAAGLEANVLDLVAWERTLDTGRILADATLNAMRRGVKLNDGSEPGYGYGIAVGTFAGHRVVEHVGHGASARASLSRYPDDDVTIAVLCNTGSDKAWIVADRVARVALGIEDRIVLDEPLSESETAGLVGNYGPLFALATPTRIDVEADHLVLKWVGTTETLLQQSRDRFVVAGSSRGISFVRKGGAVTGVVLEHGPMRWLAPKIER